MLVMINTTIVYIFNTTVLPICYPSARCIMYRIFHRVVRLCKREYPLPRRAAGISFLGVDANLRLFQRGAECREDKRHMRQ